jgi:uncharacterized protein DUF4279
MTHSHAALIITGDGLDFDQISRTLGVAPYSISEKGKRYGHAKTLCDFNMWYFVVTVDALRPLDEHIMALWDVIRPHFDYLRQLKQKFHVEVSLDVQTSNPDVKVDHRCLGLFTELELPFRISVIRC